MVQAAHSPLGFCVLALLIVESFLFGAGTLFDLSASWRIAAIGVGVLLFLVVFFTVVRLVVRYPQNLVFSEESHVLLEEMKLFGTEGRIISGRDLSRLELQSTPNPPIGQLPNSVETI